MQQLNNELRESITLGGGLIENFLEDLYITKRLLIDDGMEEKDLDSYIADKVREFGEFYSEMTEEEFFEALDAETEEAHAKAQAEDGGIEIDPEELFNDEGVLDPNPMYLLQGLIGIIDDKVKKIMLVKQSLVNTGVDAEEITMAMTDYAKECDARYMNLSEEELSEEMFSKIMEAANIEFEGEEDEYEEENEDDEAAIGKEPEDE